MKTMKTKWAKAGSMFLAAAAVLSSCSNEEVIPGGETPVGERDAVKTSFSFAIPSPVSRATSDDVQGNNNFLGIESLRLMPFSNLSGDYVGANSVLAGATQLTGSDITNSEAKNFVKTFTDVTIPSGDIAFLFYGKAKHDAVYKGVLEMTPDASVTSLTPADIAFTLKNITEGTYTGGSYSTAAALIEAWKTNVTDALATYVGNLTEGEEKNKATELQNGYFSFNSASLENLKLALQYLSNGLGELYANYSTSAANTAKTSVDDMVTELAKDAYKDFPANLPKGAYKLNNGIIVFDENGPGGSGIVTSGSSKAYSYPSSLYYWTNAYPVAYSTLPTFTNWNNGVYSGARTPITVATTKIALNKTINYGVARLDVKAAFKSADGTVPAGKDTKVTLANHNFVVKGILIGGLPDKLDWEMHPSASDTYSKIVYDNRMNTNDYELTNAATPDFAGMTPFIYSLLPETADCSTGNAEDLGHTPNIALEVLNDGPQFYGLDGNLVPEGGTFYLVGKLTYKKDNSKSEVVRVFQQDYNTTANLSINSLAKAYNTVPDLINPRLELSLAVDINWKAGLVIDVPIGD